MKIGLISDTHDNIQNIRRAVRKFNDKHVDLVIHAGDIVSPNAVESLADVKLVGVLGNNDKDVAGLTSAFNKINGKLEGEIYKTVYDGMKFAVYHGTSIAKREQLIKSGKYDIFIYGHTHRKDNRFVGNTRVINPGTAKGWFFGLFATIAVFDTTSRNIDFINL
ncbi:MAG TPA: metallophosphoesterase [Nitrososphaeraceae archaeon]|jgi:putative phosphoesterase